MNNKLKAGIYTLLFIVAFITLVASMIEYSLIIFISSLFVSFVLGYFFYKMTYNNLEDNE